MAIRFNDGQRTALIAGTDGLNTLEIRTGTQPATGGTAASGTLLATITGITWAAGAAGVRQLAAGTYQATAVASGTAGWGRFRTTDDARRMDGAVGAEFTLADTNIVSGGTVTLTAATVTQPAG